MPKYFLEAVVFISGAAVMIFELTGSRVLAPFYGASLVVWTNLIGIILGSLSLGYLLGGRLADRGPSRRIFSAIIFSSGLAIGLAGIFRPVIMSWFDPTFFGFHIASALAAFFLFAPASVILGMIPPYALKLKLSDLGRTGRTAGGLYALSTLGSIAGTFFAGFFLIPQLGTTRIIYLLAALMIALGLAASLSRLFLKVFSIFILLIGGLFFSDWLEPDGAQVLADIDTRYNRVQVISGTDRASNRLVLNLVTDPFSIQGSMFSDAPDELVFIYTKYYRLAGHFNPALERALMIGGGAYSYPKDFLRAFPDAVMDAVEIDQGMTALAREYFFLPETERLRIYHEDGRAFLNRAPKEYYDAVLVDAFSAQVSVPYQLTTREAVWSIYDCLAPDGVVMVNLISALEGESGKFLRALYATYREIFPQVYVFPVNYPGRPEANQNIILAALKSAAPPVWASADPELGRYLKNAWTEPIAADVPVLTDDYAPVDYYLLAAFRHRQ